MTRDVSRKVAQPLLRRFRQVGRAARRTSSTSRYTCRKVLQAVSAVQLALHERQCEVHTLREFKGHLLMKFKFRSLFVSSAETCSSVEPPGMIRLRAVSVSARCRSTDKPRKHASSMYFMQSAWRQQSSRNTHALTCHFGSFVYFLQFICVVLFPVLVSLCCGDLRPVAMVTCVVSTLLVSLRPEVCPLSDRVCARVIEFILRFPCFQFLSDLSVLVFEGFQDISQFKCLAGED